MVTVTWPPDGAEAAIETLPPMSMLEIEGVNIGVLSCSPAPIEIWSVATDLGPSPAALVATT
jgi:hypothetical protein